MKTKKTPITILLLMVLSTVAHAQNYAVPTEVDFFFDPNFAIAILAGVIIAAGVQIFLTALSIASGVTAVGDLKEMYIKNRIRNSSDETYMDIDEKDDDSDSSNAGTTVAAAVGIWSIITVSISAFTGSLLAMNLVGLESVEVAVTIALVIWALFCILVVYYEGKLLGVVVGGITNVATSGFKMSANAVQGAFSKSEKAQTKDMINHTVEKVRKELKNEVDLSQLNDVVDRFVTKVDNTVPDYGTLKEDLEEILNNTKSEVNVEASAQGSSSNPTKWIAIQKIIDKASDKLDQSGGSSAQKKKLQGFAARLKKAFDEGETDKESVKKVARELSPKDEQTTDKYVEKVFDLINGSNGSGIQMEQLKQTFEEVKKSPELVKSYANKISDLDKEKVTSLLENNTNYSKEDIEKGTEEVEKYIRWVKQQAASLGNSSGDTKAKMEQVVADFFNDTGRPELQYHSLKHDLEKILDNPKDSPRVVRERTEQFSTDTLLGLITSHTSISKEGIERAKSEIESTKQSVIDRMTRVESKAKGKIETIKKKAVIQAEHARASAAAAAWWLVFTGLVSAGAAIGGALLSI
jgi:hypothetical protein